MICLNCNLQTNNPKFCGRSCAATWNNKNIRRNKAKIRKCQKCKDNYTTTNGHRSKINCPQCSFRWKSGRTVKETTLKEVRNSLAVKDKHPSWLHSRVRVNNKNWNKNLTKLPCQVCGYVIHIELCHIKSIASFSDLATLGEVNHPSNILVLCRNHHWEFDNGHLDISAVPSRS